MSIQKYRKTRLACYTAYFTMTSVFSLPPVLFATLQDQYDISYTFLGTLVLTNFCTQLTIDLIFTIFSKYFNVKKVVQVMPLITSIGLITYAIFPMLLPQYAYLGLLIGTIIFSISAGLSEVLLSPIIAAIPSENSQRDMSLLHSLYAFGFLTVVAISTIFLKLFGTENWMYLTMFWAVLPILASVLFMTSPIPDMDVAENDGTVKRSSSKTVALALCSGCIFMGSCAENSMSNWISSFMENALQIDKTFGDLLGMATFAVLLGLTRIAYAKYGKNIMRVLLVGMIGAATCYLIVGFSSSVFLATIACILTGIFTSMLWPGTLIMMEENLPGIGVAAYALIAASGDLGASIAPQLLGIVVDTVSVSNWANELSGTLNLSVEQIGLKTGMLVTSLFPILGTIIVLLAMRYFKKHISDKI